MLAAIFLLYVAQVVMMKLFRMMYGGRAGLEAIAVFNVLGAFRQLAFTTRACACSDSHVASS